MPITVCDTVTIPARGDVGLAATLWLPEGAGPDHRVPVILEMIPYRKDDWRWASDQARMGFFAEHGFAACRLDVRGTGSSGGIALDEYTAEETQDGVDAVAWLAAQPWCNGNVGMWGISYGGFTAIQVAAQRPPALKAIAPMYATDDRYTDDVHYFGGCFTGSDAAQYAVSQIGMNALPPRPAYAGPDWQQMWQARLEATPPWLLAWLRHPLDGAYYRQGSLSPRYDSITCPIYNLAGWMDGYTNAAWRMSLRCPAPTRTLIGNWGHLLPDTAFPGPTVDYLDELVRFFGHWLGGDDNGLLAEPEVIAFVREHAPPAPFPVNWPGRWRGFTRSELGSAAQQTLWLDGEALGSSPVQPGSRAISHQPAWGAQGPLASGAGAAPNGLWRDLRPEDATALIYTSLPLSEPLEILGMPALEVVVSSDMPTANLVARLSALDPEGVPCLISWGALNLTHRETHERAVPLSAGVRYTVRIELKAAGYQVAAGHRLRLTLSAGHWPLIWPSPDAGRLTIHTGEAATRLTLPLAPAGQALARQLKSTPPETIEWGRYHEQPPVWRLEEDVLAGTHRVTVADGDEQVLPDGTRLAASEHIVLTTRFERPAQTELASEVCYDLEQDGQRIAVRSRVNLTSDRDVLDAEITLDVTLNSQPFFARVWRESLPRVGW